MQRAVILFESETASSTSLLLTNARLEDANITVSYYFPQFAPNGAYNGNVSGSDAQSRGPPNVLETLAQQLLAHYISSGMILSEQLIAQGRQWLNANKVPEKVTPILNQTKAMAVEQGLGCICHINFKVGS